MIKMPQNNSEQPIEIRGHHLVAYASFVKDNLSKSDIEKILTHDQYIINKDELPFVDYVVKYLSLINSDKPVKIIEESYDIICAECPILKRENGCPYEKGRDKEFADLFGVEVGRTYTFREIKEILENSRREN